MFREPKPGYEDVMELVRTLNADYPTIAAIEESLHKLYGQHKIEFRDEIEAQGLEFDEEKGNDPWKGLYNYSQAEYRDLEGRLIPEAQARATQARIWIWQEGDASMPATKQAASTRDPNHRNYRFYRPLHPVTGAPCPHPKSGWKFAYDDDEDSPDRRSFVSLDRDARIAWGPDETKVPRIKRMLHEVETNIAKSVFSDYSDGEKQTSAMFGRSGVFLAPKHADFVSRFIQHAAKSDSTILDCFGGSGSTAHAVIKLNRGDRGRRKYILIEAADYFDSVLKPPIMKAVYSPDWRAGKPVSREGMDHCIKIVRLESYEDALNNLEVAPDGDCSARCWMPPQSQGADGFKEQFHAALHAGCGDARQPVAAERARRLAIRQPTSLRSSRPGSDESREVERRSVGNLQLANRPYRSAHRRAASVYCRV